MYLAEWTCILQGYMLRAVSLFLAFASGAGFVESEMSNNGKINFSSFTTTSKSVYHNEKKLGGCD